MGPQVLLRALDCAPDAMLIVDAAGTILFASRQACALLGYEPGCLDGCCIEQLVPERFRPQHAGYRERFVAQRRTRLMGSGLVQLGCRRDASEIPLEIGLSPICHGEQVLTVAAIRDVTEHQREQAELIHAREAAEVARRSSDAAREAANRANQAKSRFLATASHDLRQPLQTLSLLNGALRRMVTEGDPAEALVQQEAAINVMSRLLNALLDISKLESGAIKAQITSWRVSVLLEQMRREFSGIAGTKGLQLLVEPTEAWVVSDLSLIGQVLRNLLSNAFKYTEHGAVRLACRAEAESVRLEVTDTGIGMAPQELTKIGTEFYQIGVPANASRSGYGLGLSIVNRIVKLLGVTLSVESELGRGSTFALTLPSAAMASEDLERLEPQPDPRRNCAQHVLVVEDDPAVLHATCLLLKAEGYAVACAASVSEALERIRTDPQIELLITDYHLAGGETGSQVISSVRELRGPGFNAVMITGDTSAAARGLGDDGALSFLSKPVEAGELLRLLEKVLARPQAPSG